MGDTDARRLPRWTIACPVPSAVLPWVLYDHGVPTKPYASCGSAYNAMVALNEKEPTNAE